MIKGLIFCICLSFSLATFPTFRNFQNGGFNTLPNGGFNTFPNGGFNTVPNGGFNTFPNGRFNTFPNTGITDPRFFQGNNDFLVGDPSFNGRFINRGIANPLSFNGGLGFPNQFNNFGVDPLFNRGNVFDSGLNRWNRFPRYHKRYNHKKGTY